MHAGRRVVFLRKNLRQPESAEPLMRHLKSGCEQLKTTKKKEVGMFKILRVNMTELSTSVERLKDEYGLDMGYVSIGQTGVWKLPSASVAFTDRELRPTRHADRTDHNVSLCGRHLETFSRPSKFVVMRKLADLPPFGCL
jgi:hypothetical protein